IRALARRIVTGDVPASLAAAKLYEIDSGALVAGARLRGEIEDRVRKLISRVGKQEQAILVARGIEQLFGQGPAGSAVGDLLKPALMRGEIRILGTTSPEGLKRIQERDAELVHEFTLLPVEEASAEQATEIVRGVAARYEKHHQIAISE